jgi:protein translocase SecG subunit
MLTVIIVIHLMLVLGLIGVVLLQKSEGGGLISSTSGFMSGRGTANVLTRTTALLAVGFFLTSLALSWRAGPRSPRQSGFDAAAQSGLGRRTQSTGRRSRFAGSSSRAERTAGTAVQIGEIDGRKNHSAVLSKQPGEASVRPEDSAAGYYHYTTFPAFTCRCAAAIPQYRSSNRATMR